MYERRVSGVLYYVSSTLNPILYNVMSHRYRRAFRDTLIRCRRSRRQPTSSHRTVNAPALSSSFSFSSTTASLRHDRHRTRLCLSQRHYIVQSTRRRCPLRSRSRRPPRHSDTTVSALDCVSVRPAWHQRRSTPPTDTQTKSQRWNEQQSTHSNWLSAVTDAAGWQQHQSDSSIRDWWCMDSWGCGDIRCGRRRLAAASTSEPNSAPTRCSHRCVNCYKHRLRVTWFHCSRCRCSLECTSDASSTRLPAIRCHVTTLGKSFTRVNSCHQTSVEAKRQWCFSPEVTSQSQRMRLRAHRLDREMNVPRRTWEKCVTVYYYLTARYCDWRTLCKQRFSSGTI